MAENPLLPHRKLQELYRLMDRCLKLERKQHSAAGAREAFLAATTIHLEAGDILSGATKDASAKALAPASKSDSIASNSTFTPKTARLPLAAATARGLQAAGGKGILLVYSASGLAEPGWEEALAWAQAERLPLVFAITDATSGKSTARQLSWRTLDSEARKLQLPTLTVDGEDAVAIYRAMQESTLRARSGFGPSVIWAVLTPAGEKLESAAKPVARLKRYMTARKIPLTQ